MILNNHEWNNKQVLLAVDKFMPEIDLLQPGFK